MTLFITSSPYLDGADRAILNPENHFIDRLRDSLPEYPSVLFIASDPDSHGLTCRFGGDTASALLQAGIVSSSYAVLDGSNADQAENLVSQSDLIVLAGGHVPTQNAFFHSIRLREILAEYSGVVMGISAGSMNMADTVYVQPEEPGESIDPEYRRWAPGLGLTDVNILPHYQKCKYHILDGQRLFEDITYPDSFGNLFFALPDGSYIYQDEEQQLLFGEAFSLRDGELEFVNASGDELNLAEIS